MVALKRLGRREEAEHLNRIANKVRAKIAARKEEPRRTDAEVGVVKRRLITMRYAVEALLVVGKRDAADTVEHAIHALELALKGRHTTEAMHIRKTAPDVGQQAELLLHAAEILADRGAKDKADMVARLGREFAQQSRREHAQREGKKSERPVQRERAEEIERLARRVERIEDKIEALAAALERFQGQLEKQRRQRR